MNITNQNRWVFLCVVAGLHGTTPKNMPAGPSRATVPPIIRYYKGLRLEMLMAPYRFAVWGLPLSYARALPARS